MRNLDIRNIKFLNKNSDYAYTYQGGNYYKNQVKSMRLGTKQVWPCLKGHIMFTSEGQTSLLYHPSASLYKTYLEYSYDTVTWSELIEDSTVSYDIEHPLYLRGKNNEHVSSYRGLTDTTAGYQTIFTFSGDRTRCYGNVMSLLNYDRDSMVVPPRAFYGLFYNCTLLVKGPDLPATYLYSSAYAYMFYGCTSLETLPEIAEPEYTSIYVYDSMFYGCTSLTEGFIFNSAKDGIFSGYLYHATFANCSSLRRVRTNFEVIESAVSHAFSYTFENCTSLVSIPWFNINSDSVAEACFRGMFKGCTSLKSVPDIKLRKIRGYVFANTFENCTSLTTAPKIISEYMYDTDGSKGCYEMFKGCTSLTTVPLIGAYYVENLYSDGTNDRAVQCYERMFYNCPNLNYVVLGAKDLNHLTCIECFNNWLYGVAETGTLVIDKNLPISIGQLICPSGWTISQANLSSLYN